MADGNLTVSKDGGDVDAITAATISSRAFLDAVNRAYSAYAGTQKWDGESGATSVDTDTETTSQTVTEKEGDNHE